MHEKVLWLRAYDLPLGPIFLIRISLNVFTHFLTFNLSLLLQTILYWCFFK